MKELENATTFSLFDVLYKQDNYVTTRERTEPSFMSDSKILRLKPTASCICTICTKDHNQKTPLQGVKGQSQKKG